LFYARIRSPDAATATNAMTDDFASDNSWLCSASRQDHWETPGFNSENWTPAIALGGIGIVPWRASEQYLVAKLAGVHPGTIRAALVAADPLMVALARPNREQVVTTRPTTATTLQALELMNGETLAEVLKRGANNLLAGPVAAKGKLIATVYEEALGRKPSASELDLARDIVGQPAQAAGIEDFLWAVAMLPEFQLIY
jgi:hypothetical protein